MSSQIVVPAAARSVISATPKTTFKVGTYNALGDTFTSVLDLNDHVNYWLVSADLAQPKKVYSRSTTIRAQGERIANWNYQNRHITLTIQLLYEAGTSALLGAVRALLAAIENPPYRLAFAAPNSTVLTYADVVAVTHTIPYDGKQILAQTLTKITIDFECAPGLAGDRITLSNLVVNPGFEAPSGPGVNVFNDTLNNTDAYTLVSGGAPAAGAGTMNIAAGSTITFGSPAWSAINMWTVRYFFATGLGAYFVSHYTNSANQIQCYITGTSIVLRQIVAGVVHNIASATIALTNAFYYWVQITQFPAAPGSSPYMIAQLINDNNGTPTGSVVATLTGPTFDAVTALSGVMALAADPGTQFSIGGAFPNVHTVNLFGPGAWTFVTNDSGATGTTAGAWDQNTSNTYGGGAATSYGAARMDFPPAGTVGARWDGFNGGAISSAVGLAAAATGQTISGSVWVKTNASLSGTCTLALILREWDASGAFLRQTTLQQVTGAHTNWTQLQGSLTLGASTVYVSVQIYTGDPTAGASAHGVVWFDNAQCWNQTTTGQTTMPYCELRFPQSPAQLLLTGLQGDLPASAYLDVGLPIGAITVSEFAYTLGVRATSDGRGALIAGAQAGRVASSENYALNSTVYGGYTISATPDVSNYPVLGKAAGLLGAYHVFAAVYPNDNHYSNQSATLDLYELLSNDATSTIYTVYNPVAAPWSPTAAQWYWYDAGAVYVPVSPALGREDQTLKWLMLQLSMNDSAGSPTNPPFYLGPVVLMPIDGGLLSVLIFPNTSAVSNMWAWSYLDPPQPTPTNALTTLGGWRNSIEATSTPNPAHATGGVNVSGPMDTRSLADNELLLDPTNTGGLDGSPILQAAAVLNDVLSGRTYPVHHEIHYTPLYLYPRQS